MEMWPFIWEGRLVLIYEVQYFVKLLLESLIKKDAQDDIVITSLN